MLYRIKFMLVVYLRLMIYIHVSELLALQTLAMLPLHGHSQTSTDVQAHMYSFYNTLAS